MDTFHSRYVHRAAGSASARCSSPAPASSGRPATTTRRSPCCAAPSSSASTTSTPPSTTAPTSSNALIREALHPYPDDLVLVSKVGAVRDDEGGWIPAQRPDRAARRRRGQPPLARRRAARRGQPAPDARRPPARGRRAGRRSRTSSPRWWRCARRARSPASASPPSPCAQVEQAIDAGRHRLRAERVQPGRPQRRATCSTRCHDAGIAYVPVLPARLRVPGHAEGHRERRRARDRRAPRRHPGPGRARLAARAPRQRAADPGHVERGAPRGEPRGPARSPSPTTTSPRWTRSADVSSSAQHGVRRLDLLVDDRAAARRTAGTPTSSR